jgi:hypothetical protein
MSDIYHDGSRQLQDEFVTRRLADRLEESIVQDSLMPNDKTFIERLDMFFIATVDERGHVNCSYKAGEPGFVRVLNEHTIAFSNYDGIPHDGQHPQMKLVQRSRFVPKKECPTPVPGWKQGDWVADALPANDPARDKSREVIDR